MVESSEGSGEVVGALEEVGAIYMRRLERAVDRISTLIVPLAEVVLGVLIFLLAYAYIVPLFYWHGALMGA